MEKGLYTEEELKRRFPFVSALDWIRKPPPAPARPESSGVNTVAVVTYDSTIPLKKRKFPKRLMEYSFINQDKTFVPIIVKTIPFLQATELEDAIDVYGRIRASGCWPHMSLLAYTTLRGWADISKRLIEEGVDVNEGQFKGRNALSLACKEHMFDVVHMLLDAGADVNCVDDFGETAMHFAIYSDTPVDVVRAIVEAGHPVNRLISPVNNKTPLTVAIEHENVPVVRYLVQQGADVNVISDYYSPISAAAALGNLEIVQLLLQNGAEVYNDHDDKTNVPVLFSAAKHEDTRILQLVIDWYKDLNKVRHPGDEPRHTLHRLFLYTSAVHIAQELDNKKVIKMLANNWDHLLIN